MTASPLWPAESRSEDRGETKTYVAGGEERDRSAGGGIEREGMTASPLWLEAKKKDQDSAASP
jgi:hypothetical protein